MAVLQTKAHIEKIFETSTILQSAVILYFIFYISIFSSLSKVLIFSSRIHHNVGTNSLQSGQSRQRSHVITVSLYT